MCQIGECPDVQTPGVVPALDEILYDDQAPEASRSLSYLVDLEVG
jgi:hypothetical protein